jgi:hypothetical protein
MAAASMQRGRGRWFIRAKALGSLLDGGDHGARATSIVIV